MGMTEHAHKTPPKMSVVGYRIQVLDRKKKGRSENDYTR
jgi:hypothetical protein